MGGKVIVLIGYPGVGKLSIAQEIAAQLPNSHIVDNHRCNNVFFPYLKDIQGSLKGHRVWQDIRVVRNQLLDFLAEAVDTSHHLIFTGFYEADDDIESLLSLVQRRGAALFSIVLTCNDEEWLKRAQTPAREKLFKLTNPTILEEYKANSCGLLYPEHPNTIEIEVSQLSAREAAENIVKTISA